MSAVEVFRRVQPREYFNGHVERGLRLDGRPGGLQSLRPISISSGPISSADGSSIVKKGNTSVICGIVLSISSPEEDSPNQGFILPTVDLPSMCNPRLYKSRAQTSNEGSILTKFVNDVIVNSGVIDSESLVIVPGEYVWVLRIDLSVLNHDGNVRDALITALVLALKSLRIPKVNSYPDELEEKTQIAVLGDEYSSLSLGSLPVSVTIAVLEEGDRLLVDPTEEEENFAPDSVTVVLNEQEELCYFVKNGGQPISDELLNEVVDLARAQALTVRKLINKN